MTMLRAESLCLRQGTFVLHNVNLDCSESECLALLGASGSGKTTCLEIMAGLRRADSGRVWINGREVTGVPPESRAVSYLPQDVAIFPHLSVRDNILFPARMRRLRPDADRLDRLCDMLGIVSLLRRNDVRSLSGGESQRVAIARALMVPPRVLFLDECFGSLDAPLRRRLARQFRDLREITGTTTVMVTHDIEEACLMANRLAVMHRGTVQQIGTPAELRARPATRHVAEILGMHNILPVRQCERRNSCWRCDVGGVALSIPVRDEAASPPNWLGFFAWDVLPFETKLAEAGSDGCNRFRLTVVECTLHGSVALLRLSTEPRGQTIFEAYWHAGHDPLPARNECVEVYVAAERIHAFSEVALPGDSTDAAAEFPQGE